MAKDRQEESFRPRARSPRGFEDRFAGEVTAQRAMLERICAVYERHGFEPLETPALEYADALGKFLPDQDRPNEGVFGFQDDDRQWLALRYDLTAPLARLVAERFDSLPKPFRRYQMGPVWRNEKPGPGRFREFWQCDADTVGAAHMAADAELAAMLADCMEAVGIPRGDYVVRVNNRKVLNGVLERIGALDADDPGAELKRLTVLRAVDKLDRLGPEGVRLLLGPGRKDESGDFTPGAGLSGEQTAMVMAFTEAGGGGRAQVVARLGELVANSPAGREGIGELGEIAEMLDALGYGEDRVTFDPSVVRGLGYYTGPVFEADLTFEIMDEKGRPVRFGSVASGGRYDDLVKRFKGAEVPATGCSIGVSRLLSALKALGRIGERAARGPVVVLVMDKDRLPDYARMAQELRNAGVRAEVYLGGGGMKAQLKYADKRGAPVAVIQGGDEWAKGEVTLKDLILGAEMAAAIADNREWREAQPAQAAVRAGDLVAGVKAMLARHKD